MKKPVIYLEFHDIWGASLKELRQYAKALGLKGYSKLKRDDLVYVVLNAWKKVKEEAKKAK